MTEFNKEVQKLKLALTSDCSLRCAHCFIDKSAGLTLSFEDAARAVDLFLGSPHDHTRRFPGGGGSYSVVSKKCALAVWAPEGQNLVAILCVHPARAMREAAYLR